MDMHEWRGVSEQKNGGEEQSICTSSSQLQVVFNLQPQLGQESESLSETVIKQNAQVTALLNHCNPGTPG